jgi:hypothetical protein
MKKYDNGIISASAWLKVVAVVLLLVAPVAGEPTDPAATEAIRLLEQSIRLPTGDASGAVSLLPALRQLKDPDLRPLFTFLSRSDKPILQVHGILGLGELSEPAQIDIVLLAQVEDTAIAALILAEAIDNDLVTPAQIAEVLTWADLGIASRLIIATRMVGDGRFDKPQLLSEALESNLLARRAIAALLLHELGDPAATAELEALNHSQDASRDAIRNEILKIAVRHNLGRIVDWAYAIAIEAEDGSALQLNALRAVLRFGHDQSLSLWREQYQAADDIADRARLAFVALDLAPFVETQLFDPLVQSKDPMFSTLGRAGQAIAGRQDDRVDQIVALVQLDHPLGGRWAMDYAKRHADVDAAAEIYQAVILAANQGPAQGAMQRVEDAVLASEALARRDRQAAVHVLGPIVAVAPPTGQLVRAILMGLLRSGQSDAGQIIDDLGRLQKPKTKLLALLLMAMDGQAIDERQMRNLAMLVRGGGQLSEYQRVVAGWIYLKRLGLADAVLKQILSATP